MIPEPWHTLLSRFLQLLLYFLITLSTFLTFSAWKSLPNVPESGRKIGWWIVGILSAFLAGDWILIAALPRLGLSFGPVGSIWLLGFAFRMLALILLAALMKSCGKLWRRVLSGPGMACGLALAVTLNLGLSAFLFESMYHEPFNLQVTELHLPAPSFIAGRPLRIVQLSDIHVERTTHREREMLAKVRALQPDLIVLTGDYLNLDYAGDPRSVADAHSVLGQLSAPYGVYAVIGNSGDWNAAPVFAGLEITILDNITHTIHFDENDLYLIGIRTVNTDAPQALAELRPQVPPDGYTLLLHHQPEIFEAAVRARVDLLLVGHTHGGQIALPLWGDLLARLGYNKEHEYGLYTEGQTTMFVTRGIGMEGLGLPRMRFGCPPEIVLIELGGK